MRPERGGYAAGGTLTTGSARSSCARLLLQRQAEEAAAKKEMAGDVKASWGDQMRSYVLQPYQMVKDLRTEYEVGNPSAVFDGDIDGFIEAGVRWRKEQDKEHEKEQAGA